MNYGWVGVIFMGWLGGWIVNYLTDVLPLTRRIAKPVCTQCNHEYPIGQYLLGKACPLCGQGRSWRFWIVQFAVVGMAIYTWFYPSHGVGFWIGFALLLYLGVVAVIDIEHRVILYQVSIFGVALGLAIGVYLHGLLNSIIGGGAGFLIMLGLYYLGDWFARFLAKRRGETLEEVALGFGDVNLAGILGLIMGWPGIIGGLVLAIVLGGVASLFYIIYLKITKRYHLFIAIPYAPFLILGLVILLYR